jgi:hypothetical protein
LCSSAQDVASGGLPERFLQAARGFRIASLQARNSPIRHAEHERVRLAANFDLRKSDAIGSSASARLVCAEIRADQASRNEPVAPSVTRVTSSIVGRIYGSQTTAQPSTSNVLFFILFP